MLRQEKSARPDPVGCVRARRWSRRPCVCGWLFGWLTSV